MIKLNLGCGRDFSDSILGIDIHDYGQQYVLDLEKDKLPFEDNSVGYIYAKHFMEHLRDPRHLLNECWRVLKRNGVFDIVVPYGLWDGASKPVHYQSITACWFDFLRKDNAINYGYRVWVIDDLEERINKDNEIYEIKCTMKPKK